MFGCRMDSLKKKESMTLNVADGTYSFKETINCHNIFSENVSVALLQNFSVHILKVETSGKVRQLHLKWSAECVFAFSV